MKAFAERYPGFEIKGLKFFTGMDGHGFNATIYKDGRKICLALNDGRGGCNHYEGLSDADQQMLLGLVEVRRTELKADPVADKEEFGSKDSDILNLDIFIEDMCLALDFERRLRRAMKKKTLFCIPGMKDGEAREINHPYDAKIKEHILKKYPAAQILNEVLR